MYLQCMHLCVPVYLCTANTPKSEDVFHYMKGHKHKTCMKSATTALVHCTLITFPYVSPSRFGTITVANSGVYAVKQLSCGRIINSSAELLVQGSYYTRLT